MTQSAEMSVDAVLDASGDDSIVRTIDAPFSDEGGFRILSGNLGRACIKVSAVDNGPMNAELMDSGLVEHFRADGFTFRPRKPVNWMVCDIVEKPARNAALLETWIGEGLCREAVVNLKLPMKQRYAEVKRLLERIADGLAARGVKASIGCKQLYHDREEVTCHLRRL